MECCNFDFENNYVGCIDFHNGCAYTEYIQYASTSAVAVATAARLAAEIASDDGRWGYGCNSYG